MSKTKGNGPAGISMLIGDDDAETLNNIGCVLQVLSDAALSELSSAATRRGWWLLIQEISQVALASGVVDGDGSDALD